MSNQVITIESPPQEFEKDDDPLKRAEPLPATSQDSISKQKRGKLISFAALALLALVSLMVLFWRISAGSSYVRFEPSLLTITVTFAVFAVNFSFVEYQLSPYRAMFRGIAWMHVFSALCVLLVAIIPIGAALMGRAPGRVAALLLPLIAVSSVVLALVARRCADPIRRAQDASHRKTVHKFVKQFASAAKRELNRTAGLNLSTSGNGPMHEWDYDRLPPRVDFYDPFDSLLALASASASSGDGQVFDKASDCMLTILKSITLCKELTLTDNTKADYRVRAMVLDHSRERLIQLARMTLDTDKIDRFARGFAEALVFHLRNEAAQFRQTDEFARIVTSTLSLLAVETYKRGWRTTPMRTLMVVRECVTMGMKRSSEDDKSMSFFYELIRFPHVVDTLAATALEKSDTEFLYRCLDTLGWMGCAAVKADRKDVGLACAQSLIQVARKSRFKKLECFWSRCGMLPWQHARKRIEWMLSWVPRIKDDISRKRWLESFSEAYSRVAGKSIEINLEKEGDEFLFKLKQSGKPHTVTYVESDSVTYDYSDESMLRDLELY